MRSAISEVTPNLSSTEISTAQSETEADRKPIAAYLILPIWGWFLIDLVILLAWLFG